MCPTWSASFKPRWSGTRPSVRQLEQNAPANADQIAAKNAADRRLPLPNPPAEDRAVSSLGERFHVPVLRAAGHAGGHALAPRRRADEFLRLFPADPGDLLSAADAQRRPLDLGQTAARLLLDGQRRACHARHRAAAVDR